MGEKLIDRIKRHEGWRSKPYADRIHGWAVPTFGYGFTYITKEEGEIILRNRLQMIESKLKRELRFYNRLEREQREVLVEMAYQLGIEGLRGFRKFLKALEEGDNERAAFEMLDSKWARQTPRRAEELADIIRGVR